MKLMEPISVVEKQTVFRYTGLDGCGRVLFKIPLVLFNEIESPEHRERLTNKIILSLNQYFNKRSDSPREPYTMVVDIRDNQKYKYYPHHAVVTVYTLDEKWLEAWKFIIEYENG